MKSGWVIAVDGMTNYELGDPYITKFAAVAPGIGRPFPRCFSFVSELWLARVFDTRKAASEAFEINSSHNPGFYVRITPEIREVMVEDQ